MPVGPDKVRTNITFDKQLKDDLTEIAKEEGRSMNNLVIKVLADFVKERKETT
ncbi:ribbon-helix-helix domain-containing protein [Shouchella miscanthi]|uniref:CopG-like ribbon-helix-helix domain-containing protein n=1 Tax=Shouchella miscanthi TaxID=2598861 RepID=A0ABU6NH20_9BACI|nr:hypothetical protein [Shouchella miscanthi]